MTEALPQQVNYDSVPSLDPLSTAREIVVRSNDQSYTANQTIVFDLNAGGFMDGKTLFLRYKVTHTNVGAVDMAGTPVYTPFSQFRLNAGSQRLEDISQYGQVCNLLVNGKYDIASKYGVQSAFAYNEHDSIENLDGRSMAIAAGASYTCSAPLPCMLSHADKYIPMQKIGGLRIELTVDSLANMFNGTAPSAFSISNAELVYKQVDIPAAEEMIKGKDLVLRSHTYNNTSALLPVGTSGNISLVYNSRLSSIRAAFILAQGANGNKQFDAVDVTNSDGAVNIQIAGIRYPQTPLNTATNKAGILMGLKGAMRGLYADASPSINAVEFAFTDVTALAVAPTIQAPAKCYFAIDTSVLSPSAGAEKIMSGVSSQNSSVTVDFQLGTATVASHNVSLILAADVLLTVTAEGDVFVKQ
jgi:hypothetical protein